MILSKSAAKDVIPGTESIASHYAMSLVKLRRTACGSLPSAHATVGSFFNVRTLARDDKDKIHLHASPIDRPSPVYSVLDSDGKSIPTLLGKTDFEQNSKDTIIAQGERMYQLNSISLCNS